MENPIKMDDLGGKPLFFGNAHIMTGCLGVRERMPQAVDCFVEDTEEVQK